MAVWRERITLVWAALVALTAGTTWGLSKDLVPQSVAVTGIVLVAAVKVRFVMLDFMELRRAPLRARVFFQVWIVAVVAIILGFWFAGPP